MNTLMKSLLGYRLHAYMEEERHQFIQAASHERLTSAKTIATVACERQWTLSIGTLKLHKSHARVLLASSKPSPWTLPAQRTGLLSMMERWWSMGSQHAKSLKSCRNCVARRFPSLQCQMLSEAVDPEIEAFKPDPDPQSLPLSLPDALLH